MVVGGKRGGRQVEGGDGPWGGLLLDRVVGVGEGGEGEVDVGGGRGQQGRGVRRGWRGQTGADITVVTTGKRERQLKINFFLSLSHL